MSSRSPVMAFDNGKSSLRGVPRVIMKDYSGRSSSACSNVEVYHYSDSVFRIMTAHTGAFHLEPAPSGHTWRGPPCTRESV